MPSDEVLSHLNTSKTQGLSDEEANQRLEEHGRNEITSKKTKNIFWRFLDHFKQPLIYILLIAAAVSFMIKEHIDAAVICGVAFINAFIGFIQEFKAEKAIAALAQSVVTEIRVLRNGNTEKITSQQIVPGDIIILSSGDKVPADLRLFESRDLQINESTLTGESVPTQKNTDPADTDAVVGDQTSMAFAGTLVTRGTGKGVVTATGQNTETGRISQMMDEGNDLETPLTRKIQAFSKTLLWVILFFSGIIFLLAVLKGLSWIEGFKGAVALAVSAIPEGLPAAITVTLAIGVNRMAQRHAIIRKLPAVEALGSTTVICSDKTGTLTQNKMKVQRIYAGQELYELSEKTDDEAPIRQEGNPTDLNNLPTLKECLVGSLLCNDSHLENKEGQYETVGDPTEGALLLAVMQTGIDRSATEQNQPRIDTIPFESEKQYMATLNKGGDTHSGNIIYLKGSVESVLERCETSLDREGGKADLNPDTIHRQASSMAQEGLRVLAFAKKKTDSQKSEIQDDDTRTGMIFLGLIGMIDPPRPEAIEAIKVAQRAGIKIKMITGDHVETAQAIADKMGIRDNDQEKVYSGKMLADMSDKDFSSVAASSSVFARVAPEHKLRLVKTLQSQNEIVAVTGDGVNDAPALQQADIGVAMGLMGTEVAQEAADMILTDDNFSSIEGAVEEGRTVYSNILKAIGFILPVNGGEALTIFAGLLFASVIPILPVQILWVNMVSSVALMLTLAFEPKQNEAMTRPPHSPQEKLLTKSLIIRVITISIFNFAVTFGMFEIFSWMTDNIMLARTVAITTLISAETFYLLSISRCVPSLWDSLRGKSVQIAYAPLIGITFLILVQYLFSQWGFMNDIFGTHPLTAQSLFYCIGAGLLVLVPAFILKRYASIQKNKQ